jgi:DNA-binding CsgD family transcriptional regulator
VGPADVQIHRSWADGYVAVLYNGLGRFPEAFAAAKRACDAHPSGGIGWVLAELVEAAVRCDEHEIANDALKKLTVRTRLASKDWGLGLEAYCRALLSDGEQAEAVYIEATERLQRADMPLPLARAELVYGEWLRRHRRRTDARERLERAYAICDELGAAAFAQRARYELAATGVTAHSRRQANLDELTPQEARVAKLASDGLTNAEIGAQLYITASTVEYHLRKVFRKLGLRSRAQLHGAIALSAT